MLAAIAALVAGGVGCSQPRTEETDTGGTSLRAEARTGAVLTGIDVLERDGFRRLEGLRVGLLTNQTGVNRQRVSTARLLQGAEGVELVALFSPEHGLEGVLEQAVIPDTQDAATGVVVYSLYGATRTPTAASLARLDALVFDIQDIGTRFYTYVSTMGNAMQAAAEQGIRFVVLDRPNPINGVAVQGPVLDDGAESFVGFHSVPVRHGMTVGELARLFRAERALDLELEVVQVEGWRRTDWFDATGLPWTNPSPNMRSLTQALLYPGVGLLETTNVSVGRGTDTPFEVMGAPWIVGTDLARRLNEADLPGVRFVPVRFVPRASVYEGQACEGVNLIVTRREEFHPLRTGIALASALRSLYPDLWDVRGLNRLLGSARTRDAILAGEDESAITSSFARDALAFEGRRAPFLLYR